MPATAIEIKGLRKSNGAVEAVRGIALSVAEGEGSRRRDAGTVSVLGFDPASGNRKLKEQIGIVLQKTGIDPYLTVAETIDMFRGYYPAPRPRDEGIGLVGLAEKRGVKVTKLSGGQQRRRDVAIALAGDPRLLFLDEPTTGFDPGARRGAWEVIKSLASLGKTIFLTSHAMDEVEYLADRVAIIAAGRIVAEGPPSTLAGRTQAATVVKFQLPANAPALPEPLRQGAKLDGANVEIATPDPTRTLYELT